MRLTYLGSVDDSVKRYPWFDQTNREIKESLLHELLFGNEILLNDGYLLNNIFCRRLILDPTDNILKKLIKAGYIYILSRTDGDFVKLVDGWAEQGIDTFKKLRESKMWYKKTHSQLTKLSDELKPYIKPSPTKNYSEGFDKLALSLESDIFSNIQFKSTSRSELLEVIRKYADLPDRKKGPRNNFEKILLEKQKNDNNILRTKEIMRIMNELYQINYAACIAADEKYMNDEIFLNSVTPTFFPDLIKRKDYYIDDNDFSQRDFPIPKNILIDDVEFLDELTKPKTSIYKQKDEYIKAKEKLLNEYNSINKRDYYISLGNYNESIKEYARKKKGQQASKKMELIIDGVVTGFSAIASGFGLTGIGVGLASQFLYQFGKQKSIGRRFFASLAQNNQIIYERDFSMTKKGYIASEMNKEKSIEHAITLPVF